MTSEDVWSIILTVKNEANTSRSHTMDNNTLSHITSTGVTVINHAAYQASLATKTDAQLHYTIKDSQAAMTAMPDGHKAGYYADEAHYCGMELTRRRQG